MLKNSFSQKNTGYLLLLGAAIFFILGGIVDHLLYPFVNADLVVNTFPFLSNASANKSTFLYGENVDMSQILPTSQHYVVNSKGQDLIDIAADLGINLFRITNVQRSFNNNQDSIYTKDQWNQVLNKMQSKGIKAEILIEAVTNNGDYYTADIRPVYLHLVQEFIDSGVFAHPDVYAVDIKNEPVLTDANMTMLEAAHKMIKAKYPDLKQTIGWWATPQSPDDPYNRAKFNWGDYAAGPKLDSLVDFYSVHMYGLSDSHLGVNLGPALRTKVFVSAVENGLQTKKPILIEEFGEANGDAVTDQESIGNPELQANVYQGVYQALKEMPGNRVSGAVGFDLYSRNRYPDAWAIAKNNGDYLYPAAYILQEYALGKNNPSLQAATVVTSQSYLVRNGDNGSTQTLSLSDRIGLKLQLDNTKPYSVSLSNKGLLKPVETFHYEYDTDSYYTIYQAVGQGKVQLSITPQNGTTPVYTLNLTIQ